MKRNLTRLLLPIVAFFLLTQQTESATNELKRILTRRQSSDTEQEATTAATSSVSSSPQGQQPATAASQQPARLYPDLPRQQPTPFLPPFGARPFPPNNGPFAPFGMQLPSGRLNDPPPMQQMRPMSPAERAQSQTFVDGLGRRLMSMLGIDASPSSNNATMGDAAASGSQSAASMSADELMRSLRNSSVLMQLNSGVHSVYGSLSKMYNNTVQQQLDLLQEKFKREAANSTNNWQQRMAQQVPNFFKTMAMKVEEAQQNLNRIWRQVSMANNGSIDRVAQQSAPVSRSFFADPMSQFAGPADQGLGGEPGGNFFNQLGRQFGMGGAVDPNGRQDFGGQLMEFWQNQVQPQIGMVRGQVARIWRDLTSSGALMPQPMSRSRNVGGLGATHSDNKPSSDIVDNVLKEVESSGPEYMLVQPAGSEQAGSAPGGQAQQPQPDQGRTNPLSTQMQTRLIAMQRELNHLWNGLSNSLQNALMNVRNSMNPRGSQFDPLGAQGSNIDSQTPDPAENEIGNRIEDLNKIQRDADNVYNTVQRQQQAQVQRPSFTDRFMNFFGNMDVDQFQDRIGEQVSRFGNMVGNLWHQIPERWDNFMQQNRRPQDMMNNMANARLVAAPSTTQKPSSPVTSAT